ncbi:MAG TPA: hypothetical protein ENO20_14570 [Bacteroides sp.]|nr:hypothetical protein [Bacteroides sp.]
MKKNTFLICLVCLCIFLFSGNVFSQDEEDLPIRPPFETISLIDNQTTVSPFKGTFNFEIQHRFSQIRELADLFGIYGTANTRLALAYGVTDRIMVGVGTTRDYMLQDLEWKYAIMTQTRSGKIPVSLSYYGNAVLDARGDENFGPEEEYRFIHRLSYLNQLIVSRNFAGKFSFQVAPTFVYHNAVPEGYRNANASIYFGGRLMVLGFHSIVFEYDQPLLMPEEDVYPNIAAGVEFGTSTHAFRIFVSNYNAIIRNRSIAFNGNNPFDGDYQFGFNISVRF